MNLQQRRTTRALGAGHTCDESTNYVVWQVAASGAKYQIDTNGDYIAVCCGGHVLGADAESPCDFSQVRKLR